MITKIAVDEPHTGRMEVHFPDGSVAYTNGPVLIVPVMKEHWPEEEKALCGLSLQVTNEIRTVEVVA